MYKGTNASDGIGIGTAVIVEEAELIITRREVNDTEAEVSVLRERWKQPLLKPKKWLRIWLPVWVKRKPRSCRAI